MGIDLRQSRSGKHDRNKYYKANYVSNMQLLPNAVPEGIFYSTDKEPMTIRNTVLGNTLVRSYSVTIETFDTVGDLAPNDYVLYGGELFIVDSVISDDENKTKEFNNRPTFRTVITLRR